MKHSVLRFCILAVVLTAIAAFGTDSRKPNMIFIMVDDAGLGDFGCYGGKHIPTPNVDRLAKEGMLFSNAYSGSAVCAPTRATLMTGRHTGHNQRRANNSKDGLIHLADDEVTVAEVLKKAGYATGGFGKWGLGNPNTSGVPEKQGFDVFFGYYDQKHAHDYYTDHLIRNSERVPLPGNADGKRTQYSHDLVADETLKFIEQNKDKPYFAYAAWTLPHGKYEIPSNAPFDKKPWPEQVRNYAAMIARIDTDVGRLVAKLKELKLDKNTLVFFTSDNGANAPFVEPLGSSAGLRGIKRDLHEGGIRAPFIAWWPGKIRAGTRSDLLTSHVDFLQTAADIAKVEAPKNVDGISILPTLLGKPQSVKHDFLYWEIYEGPSPFQQAVRYINWKGYRTALKGPLELYNLESDPAESKDISKGHPEIVKQIEGIMAQEHISSPHWIPTVDPQKTAAKKKAKKS